MTEEDAKKFVGTVHGMLRDLGTGIGQASRAVVGASQTPVSTLAVKTADVTVEFELSAQVVNQDIGAELVVPRPRITSSQTTATAANKATITLKIVAIEPGTPVPALPPSWPWDRWTVKDVREAANALGRLATFLDAHAADHGLEKSRGKLAAEIDDLVGRAGKLDDEKIRSYPDGARLVAELTAISKFLDNDKIDAATLRADRDLPSTVRTLHAFLRGVATGAGG